MSDKQTMSIQRLRNLTTGRLHTQMGHVYQDIERLTGEEGIMTHMLPRACEAMEPWLRDKAPDPRFWDGEYDTAHVGEFEISPMTDAERKEFLARYSALPDPLAGKEVIVVKA